MLDGTACGLQSLEAWEPGRLGSHGIHLAWATNTSSPAPSTWFACVHANDSLQQAHMPKRPNHMASLTLNPVVLLLCGLACMQACCSSLDSTSPYACSSLADHTGPTANPLLVTWHGCGLKACMGFSMQSNVQRTCEQHLSSQAAAGEGIASL